MHPQTRYNPDPNSKTPTLTPNHNPNTDPDANANPNPDTNPGRIGRVCVYSQLCTRVLGHGLTQTTRTREMYKM